jgi:hypothetical protein
MNFFMLAYFLSCLCILLSGDVKKLMRQKFSSIPAVKVIVRILSALYQVLCSLSKVEFLLSSYLLISILHLDFFS